MSNLRIEQETIINWNQQEDIAELYTAARPVYNKMVKRGYTPERVGNSSWRFLIPKKHIKLPSKPRVLSEKQKKLLAERGKVALQAARTEKGVSEA